MGNLQRQIAGIKQQLALSTAETLARLKKVDTDVEQLQRRATEFQETATQLQASVKGLQGAMVDQGTVQQTALDQLLDLVAEDQADMTAWKASIEDRLSQIEQDRSPAA